MARTTTTARARKTPTTARTPKTKIKAPIARRAALARPRVNTMEAYQSLRNIWSSLALCIGTMPIAETTKKASMDHFQQGMNLVGDGISKTLFDLTVPQGGAIARKVTPRVTSTSGRATTTTRRSGRAVKITANDQALLNYFNQHPTATYTSKQLMQVSPFSTWSQRAVTASANKLIKSGALRRDGTGYNLIGQAMAA